VIDTALTYDDRMLAVLDLADLYVVTVTPQVGALRSARHFLHVTQALGYREDRMCFVLNRATNTFGLSLDDIASILGSRSILQMPTGGPEVGQAVNEGRPVVLHQAKTPFARALQALAEQVRARAREGTGHVLYSC
jgi:Flp pilus assembly CpaE family ATPase